MRPAGLERSVAGAAEGLGGLQVVAADARPHHPRQRAGAERLEVGERGEAAVGAQLDGAERDQDVEQVGDQLGVEAEPRAEPLRGRRLVERADDAELERGGEARRRPRRRS